MKKKIEDALRTEYAGLGLSDKTIGRLAEYVQGKVEKEEDIATAVKGDDVKLIAKSIQGEIDGLQKAKKKAEDDYADYKAKHPEKKEGEGEGGEGGKGGEQQPDIAKIVADAVAAAVKPVQDALDAYKTLNAAKEAVATAKDAFYANKWTTKYKDEADDAWEIATKLNDAKGGKMTHDELVTEVTALFNKAVQRKGVDATKPFEAEGNKPDKFDFSDQAKYLESEGLIPKAEGSSN